MKKERKVREPSFTISPEEIKIALRALEAKGMIYYTETGIYVPEKGGWKLLFGKGPVKEEIVGYGNEKISAKNVNEIKITKKVEIKDDDSVICVKANKGAKELRKEIVDSLKTATIVNIVIEADGVEERFNACGSPVLKIKSEENIVIRKDDKIDEATIAILADKAANDLKDELKEKLKNSSTKVKIKIEIL